jgi:hypothetical protein
MASLPAGDTGIIGFDVTNGRYFQLTAAGARPFKIMGFPPSHVVATTGCDMIPGTGGITGAMPSFATLNFGGSTPMSTTVTLDGSTDLMITIHFCGISMNIPEQTWVQFGLFIDSTQVDEWDTIVGDGYTITDPNAGTTHTYITSAAAADTPSAGNHTVTWQGRAGRQASGPNHIFVQASSSQKAYLRVQPVTL